MNLFEQVRSVVYDLGFKLFAKKTELNDKMDKVTSASAFRIVLVDAAGDIKEMSDLPDFKPSTDNQTVVSMADGSVKCVVVTIEST